MESSIYDLAANSAAYWKDINVGDIVLINDHINFMGDNPLIGKNDDSKGERFPDMSEIYNKELLLVSDSACFSN